MSLTGSVKLAVALEGLPALTESERQLFYQIHRPMLTTCATDSHRDIAAVVPDQRPKPMPDEFFNVPEHVINFRVRTQIVGNSFVFARQIAQA